MTANLIRQRHNGRKVANQVSSRGKQRKINHGPRHGYQEHVHVFEVSDDPV